MSELRRAGWPLALAASAWCGALVAVEMSGWWVVAALAVAVAARRPLTWCVVLLLLTDVLAVRALDGLRPPEDGPFEATVTLVTDPEPAPGGEVRVEVDSPHGRLLASTTGASAADDLTDHLAGETLVVQGRVGALSRPGDWTRSRHLRGTLDIDRVAGSRGATAPAELANRYRRLLARGAESLSDEHRALLSGLVLGDDRAQPPALTADFRAAGLTHLLAVSGQNVAFLLVVAGPVLRRLRLWPRFAVAVVAILAFALVTRFEPSVVRAAAVAAVALFARTTGRSGSGLRHLSLAVTGLLVVDPLLVLSLGFQLSVAASVGVLLGSRPIAERLPGPRWLADGLGVTIGAQLAVAPVLVPALGPMPLAALPANVLAGPLAGALMVWGLAAGTVAGAVGGPVAVVVHLPSAVGLGLLDRVAETGASLPLGSVDLRHLALLGAAVALWPIVKRRTGRLAIAAIGAAALVGPVLSPVPRGAVPVGWAATIWVDGRVAVVDVGRGTDAADVVAELRRRRIAAVGLVVARDPDRSTAAAVEAVAGRFPVGAVVAPAAAGLDSATVLEAPTVVRVSRLEVDLVPAVASLRVRIGWRRADEAAVGSAGAPRARPPPLRRHAPRRRRRPDR